VSEVQLDLLFDLFGTKLLSCSQAMSIGLGIQGLSL